MTQQDDFEAADIDVEDDIEDVADEAFEEQAPRTKKSGGMFNVIIVLVAVAGAAGIVYYKSGGMAALLGQKPAQKAAAPAPTAPAPTAMLPGTAPLPETFAPETFAPETAVPTTQVVDLAPPPADALTLDSATDPMMDPVTDPLADTAMADPLASPAAPADDMFAPAPAMEAALAPQTEVAPDTKMPDTKIQGTAAPEALAADDMFAPAQAADNAAAPAVPAETTALVPAEAVQPTGADLDTQDLLAAGPASPAPVAPVDAEIPAMPAPAAKADMALMARVDALEGKISSFATKADIEDLQSAIEALRADLKKQPSAPVAKPVTKARAEVQDYKNGIMPAPVRLKSDTANPTSSKPVSSATVPMKAVTGWTLRSAKPGMAWVSQAGSSELKTVSVGDTLTGIGKITGIEKQGQKWVVKGTKGVINQ